MTTTIGRWPLFLLALSSGAAAQTALPDYDARPYCASLAARMGSRDPAEILSCTALEGQRRAGLAPLWASVPAPIRERCLRREGRGSYDMLSFCVETEMERGR